MQTSSEGMAELAAAQEWTHYPVVDQLLSRMRYGDEAFDWHSETLPCHACATVKGQLHTPGCDVEEYPIVTSRRCLAIATWEIRASVKAMPRSRVQDD